MQKVVLVTGASSGIGRATAERLVLAGLRVFGTSRRPDLNERYPFTMLPLDVTDSESIKVCVGMVLEQAGRIDVLVNNAGTVGVLGAAEEITPQQWRELFEINFFGVVQMTHALLPLMRAQQQGLIINVSSAAGRSGGPTYFSAYSASKFALEGYSENLYYEVAPFNIRVALVEPGYMRTAIATTLLSPGQPLAAYQTRRERALEIEYFGVENGRDPALVGETILKVIETNAPLLRYPVGDDAIFGSLMGRFLPFPLYARMVDWLFQGGRSFKNGWRRKVLESGESGKMMPWLVVAGLAVLTFILGRRKRR